MGEVLLCSLSGIERNSDKVISFFIVREPCHISGDLVWLINLAPSEELFRWAKSHKGEADWFEKYSKLYRKELSTAEKRIGLKIVEDYINRGYDVNLVCFCENSKECHRSVLAEYLQKEFSWNVRCT